MTLYYIYRSAGRKQEWVIELNDRLTPLVLATPEIASLRMMSLKTSNPDYDFMFFPLAQELTPQQTMRRNCNCNDKKR